MKRIIQDMISIGQRLYNRKYIVGSEGNISCRINQEKILVTRSGACKGEMREDDIIPIDLSGKVLKKEVRPSSEIQLHLAVYRERPDVKAVIHAHPPVAVSLTLAGIPLDQPYLPECILLLGSVPTADYARPSTDQVPASIEEYIRKTDILLLTRHGSVTVGKNLKEAFQKLEILENTARIVWLAKQVGNPLPMALEEVKEIQKLRKTVYGLDYPIVPFDDTAIE
jgi:L-fuculose-phosphate aldolase